MEISKLIILFCCATLCLASHHEGQVIPVEGYESELQDLGEHVDIPETPVRVIRITKTVAVKVPVPYPVKVIEKVPYPVHVNKPYPVPVPQIVKVPYEQHGPQIASGHEALDIGQGGHAQNQHNDNSYQVQESLHDGPSQEGYGTINHGFEENDGKSNYHGEEPQADYYGQPAQEYHGSSDDQDGHNSFVSKNYQSAIQNYLNRLNNPAHLNSLRGH